MGLFEYPSWCFPQPSTESDRTACCSAVPIKPLRPDLAIYSQNERLAAGAAPIWLNPDIIPDIRAEFSKILVTVRNLSPQVSALNGMVSVALAFPKIGSTPLPNGTQEVSVPPGGQAQLTFPVTVPLDQIIEPGPYDTPAVLVQLVHPDDDVLINNNGEFRRIKASNASSGPPDEFTSFGVTVVNPTQTPQRASFAALDVVPSTLAVVFVPAVQDIPAEGEASVVAQVRPPPPDGAQVTVACRDPGGRLLGGATYVFVP